MSMICSSFLRSNMWTALQSQFWDSLYIKKFLGTLWSMDTCARGTRMSDTCRTWTCIGHVPTYVGHTFDCVLLFYGYFLAEKKRLGSNLSYNPVLLCQTKFHLVHQRKCQCPLCHLRAMMTAAAPLFSLSVSNGSYFFINQPWAN